MGGLPGDVAEEQHGLRLAERAGTGVGAGKLFEALLPGDLQAGRGLEAKGFLQPVYRFRFEFIVLEGFGRGSALDC